MKTLLIVDDDIGPLQYLVDMFKMKYNVVTAESIHTAVEKLNDTTIEIDLIISDWHLGEDYTAQHIFKILKESGSGRYKDIPVIVVSSDDDNRRWVEKQNASFILKPANPVTLMNLVAEKLSLK